MMMSPTLYWPSSTMNRPEITSSMSRWAAKPMMRVTMPRLAKAAVGSRPRMVSAHTMPAMTPT